MRNVEKVKAFFNSRDYLNWSSQWVNKHPYSSKELRLVVRAVAKYAVETKGIDANLMRWCRLKRYPQVIRLQKKYEGARDTHSKKIKNKKNKLDKIEYLTYQEKETIIDKDLRGWIKDEK